MVRLALRGSRSIGITLTVIHLAAGALVFTLDVPPEAAIAVGTALLLSLGHGLVRHALLRSGGALVALDLRDGGRAAVQTRDGRWHDASVLGTTFVSPPLTVVNLRIAGRVLARHMVIVPDNVGEDDFRRLRVLLRWGSRKDARVSP